MPEVSSFDGKKRTLSVIDDLMTSTDDRVVDIFTNISHHRNLSVVYLTRQMYRRKSTIMIEAFKNATSAPYGYLSIDLKQETDDKLRLRTGIFPEMCSTFIFESNK